MGHSDTVRRLLKLLETMNVADTSKLFAGNATYQFGNSPRATGIEEIQRAEKSGHLQFVKSVTFEIKEVIEPGGGVLVCELENAYVTVDGRKVTLPSAYLFQFNEQGLIQEMRTFIDPTPLVAKPAPV